MPLPRSPGGCPTWRWPGDVAGGLTADAAHRDGPGRRHPGPRRHERRPDGGARRRGADAGHRGHHPRQHDDRDRASRRVRGPATGLWVTDGLGSRSAVRRGRPVRERARCSTGPPGPSPGISPLDEARATLLREAADSPPGARGLLVVPSFAGERRPIDDPLARGVIAGLTLEHTRGDVVRAAPRGHRLRRPELLERPGAGGHRRSSGCARPVAATRDDVARLQVVADVDRAGPGRRRRTGGCRPRGGPAGRRGGRAGRSRTTTGSSPTGASSRTRRPPPPYDAALSLRSAGSPTTRPTIHAPRGARSGR